MYIISPITVLDEDKELFETHIALNNEAKTLLLSAWGKTEKESRMFATGIIKRMNFMLGDAVKWFENALANHPVYKGLPTESREKMLEIFTREYPLTTDECYPIEGEGAESAEEL